MSIEKVIQLHEISQFIYREARLQDDHQFSEWESLWTDDGVYWLPAGGEDVDPDQKMSIIYDNRSRIGLRVAQFYTGKRHSQLPPSRLRRVISNIELVDENEDDFTVIANALVFETSSRGDIVWGAKLEYRLRRVDGELRMARKKVVLVNNDTAIYSLSFLI